jgi:hypothetical protein
VLTIGKGTPVVKIDCGHPTYTGSPIACSPGAAAYTAGNSSGVLIPGGSYGALTYTGTNTTTYGPDTAPPTNAGDYAVTGGAYAPADTVNWASGSTGSGTMTINVPAPEALMLTPTDGSTLPTGPVTFTWTPGTGVSEAWIWVGTTVGGQDLYVNGGAGVTTATAPLPANGDTVHVRLWSFMSGAWVHHDYTYTAGMIGVPAVMLTPTDGSTLPTGPVTFTWDAGTGVSQAWIWVGSTVGGQDLYVNGGAGVTTATAPLPANGDPVHVRLWSFMSGAWAHHDYTYTAGVDGVPAAMVTPAAGSTLSTGPVAFTWSAGTGVSQAWIWIGTTVGGQDLYVNGGAGVTTATAPLPANGDPVYVRLWSFINGAWAHHDYTYTAGMIGVPVVMVTPTNGSTLPAGPVTFTWNAGTGVSEAWLWIGTTVGGQDLYVNGGAGMTTATAPGLPANGATVYVRLWSFISGAWAHHDYTYTAAQP